MLDRLSRLLPPGLRRSAPVIPVVRLAGVISAGSSPVSQPLSLANVAGMLERAFADKAAPAVALVINSPGGSAVQSRLIHRRIRDLAEEKGKPVYAFCEDAAASGGYMIACAADEIHADPSSIVGSIGVIYAAFGFPEAIAKLGIERRVHTAGQNKSTLDPFLPEKDEDVAYLKSLQLEIHETFIDLVKARRGAKLADDPEMFTGRFWTGLKARELGLVDGIGDMRSVLRAKFGPKTRFRLIAAPRGLFGRRPAAALRADAGAIGAGLAEGLVGAAEARAHWNRIGL